MAVASCKKHEELRAQASSILEKIYELTQSQKELLNLEGVSMKFIRFDKEMEQLMGEKERAVGALREHDEEHGCQADPAIWNPNAPSTN